MSPAELLGKFKPHTRQSILRSGGVNADQVNEYVPFQVEITLRCIGLWWTINEHIIDIREAERYVMSIMNISNPSELMYNKLDNFHGK